MPQAECEDFKNPIIEIMRRLETYCTLFTIAPLTKTQSYYRTHKNLHNLIHLSNLMQLQNNSILGSVLLTLRTSN